MMIRSLCVIKLWKKTKLSEQNLRKESSLSNYIFYSFYILLTLLTDGTIYCHLIKYKSKQKHLFPYYVTNGKLTNVL